ncbi:MAG: putative amidophosphoribosyltransferase [Candidatus Saccharibacteria bacterium]|nr:putative amidophosphoribosyltransferase [Candidatus Saccharibacteria bacterium]
MLNVKNTILDSLLAVVAPHLCSGCGQIGSTFCDNCKYNIIDEPISACILCEKPSSQGVCADHKTAFNQAWIVGMRSGALQRLVGGFKFRNMKASYKDLADLLHKRLPQLPHLTVFVPIPTTPVHIRERGYDHMLLVARGLGRLRHLPVEQFLVRDNFLVQHRANRKDRFAQAATAFKVKGIIDPNSTYILLDDVITTGSTILQAALLLKQAGATTIWVAATSRQPLD